MKFLKKSMVFILLFIILMPITCVYAITKNNIEYDNQKEEKEFFTASKSEVNRKEEIELSINLDLIEYNDFIFKLECNDNIKNIEIREIEENKITENSNEITMQINKNFNNVNKISLYYLIPEEKNVGEAIKFKATIIEIEQNKEGIYVEKESEIKIVETDVRIVENQNADIEKNEEILVDRNTKNDSELVNISSVSILKSITNAFSTENIVQYNGSDNNYLSSLSVNGYELNKNFSKDNTTYFIEVENDIESLEVNATAENSNSNICVYGNENIKEGTNKILISVTAENGNVRQYRIIVNKNT